MVSVRDFRMTVLVGGYLGSTHEYPMLGRELLLHSMLAGYLGIRFDLR